MPKLKIVDVNKIDGGGILVEFSDGSLYQFDPEFLHRQLDNRIARTAGGTHINFYATCCMR